MYHKSCATGGGLRGYTSYKTTILMAFAFKLPNTA